MSQSSRESSPSSDREEIPLSMSEVENITVDSVTDDTILALLQKEVQLKLEIEAVQSEISVLEKGLDGENEDEDKGKKKKKDIRIMINFFFE